MTVKRAMGVAISDNHLTLVRIARPAQGVLKVLSYRHEPFQSLDDIEAILPRLVRAMKGNEDPFAVSIANQQYEIQLIDLPDVPVEEMDDALPFKVRDFVGQDVDALAMDWLPLPEQAWRGRRKMGFVVTAGLEGINNLEQRFFKKGLRLQLIEIMQCALCRTTKAANQQDPTALLVDWQGRAELIIHHHAQLLLHRVIDVSVDEANQKGDALAQHSLALEVQRSFDFLESQMALPRPAGLIVVRDEPVLDELLDQLEADLGVPSENMQLASYVDCDFNLHSPCAAGIAIGSALALMESDR